VCYPQRRLPTSSGGEFPKTEKLLDIRQGLSQHLDSPAMAGLVVVSPARSSVRRMPVSYSVCKVTNYIEKVKKKSCGFRK
jgi:hypothetical protein